MSTFMAENEHLVSDADKYYFGNATVKGLREQLRENNLPVAGLKYELYLRLVDNGIRLYTDDRSDDIDDEDEDNGNPEDDDEVPFEADDDEIDDSEEEYLEDDNGETDSNASESEDDDEEDYDEDDDQGKDDQDQDDQGHDDQGHDDRGDDQEQDGQEGGPPRSSGRKRRRDDDGDDDDSHGGDNDDNAPARWRRRIALPREIQAVIIENLNAPGVWNLINTAPEEYLRGDMNALILEARSHYRADYPRPPAAPTMPGGFKKTVLGPWPNLGPDRPLSLLEWVARRVTLDANFRTTNRTRIIQVVDAYLAVYGLSDPPPLPPNVWRNPREDLLYYFRDRADLRTSNLTPLMLAAQNQNPRAVQLLLMRAADVNEAINGVTALELASAAGFNTVHPSAYNTMLTAYALIGAGADVTVLGANSRAQAVLALGFLLRDDYSLPTPGQEVPQDFPRVDNTLGLSVRRFIADERSDPQDRMILTLFAVMYRTIDYPQFV